MADEPEQAPLHLHEVGTGEGPPLLLLHGFTQTSVSWRPVADRLATRIQQLGGVPIFDLQELAGKAAGIGVHPEQGTTLSEMVIENLLLERRQVEAYTALIRELGDKDLITRELLLGILGETETHASELADFLKRTSDKR